MSSLLADDSVSIPGSAAAILRNSGCMDSSVVRCRRIHTRQNHLGIGEERWRLKSQSDLDVEPGFRAGFDEHDVEFFRSVLPFFCGHLSAEREAEASDICMLYQFEEVYRNESRKHSPLVDKISFVPNEHDDHITTPLRADFVDPFWGVQKGLSIYSRNILVNLQTSSDDIGYIFSENITEQLMSICSSMSWKWWYFHQKLFDRIYFLLIFRGI